MSPRMNAALASALSWTRSAISLSVILMCPQLLKQDGFPVVQVSPQS